MPLCVCGKKKKKNPSLIVSEGKEHNGKLVPYVTGRISEAGAASPRASVPYAVRNSNVNLKITNKFRKSFICCLILEILDLWSGNLTSFQILKKYLKIL